MSHNKPWSHAYLSYDQNSSSNNGVKNAIECFICVEPCTVICVFNCGHYACYSCGLRIHVLGGGGCPVCRVRSEEVFLTRTISQDEDHYSTEELNIIRASGVRNSRLKCIIDSRELADEMEKLYQYLCPIEGCWEDGVQDPFLELRDLKDHLAYDHKMSYCEICLQSRPVFLCEQVMYGEAALRQHMEGICPSDSPSFIGHPPCRFCSRPRREFRLYDGEALLRHMQDQHYTCDVCNRGQFIFTYFENRQKLDHHFVQCHKVCEHPDCVSRDLMLRVFADDFELMLHKKRVHGAKSKLTFTPASFGAMLEPGEDRSGGAASQGVGGNLIVASTASNTNAVQITFDHVLRKETVELMAGRGHLGTDDRGRGRRGRGRERGGKTCVHAPVGNGLPAHFHSSRVLKIIEWPPNRVRNDASPEHIGPTQGNQDEGKEFNRAFSMPESVEAYLQRNKIPSDPQEQTRRLDELVSKHLSSPAGYAQFQSLTQDFVDSKIYAIEYYNTLSESVFRKTEVFNEIFPLLVATMPNLSKKRVLCEIWKIKMVPELQRRARAQEQDEQEAKKKEEAKRTLAVWNNISSGARATLKKPSKDSSKTKDGWMNAATKLKLMQGVVDKPDDATNKRSSWGAEAPKILASPSSPSNNALNALNSEILFPSLPRDNVRCTERKGKKQPERPNAWFRK
ncbi:unnamed protein product [Phytomonas sp. EM1]|nr:unnamed protein product [Phytomonas sp. EM1]|eukprot:CCW61674.1 unnamed protein product [Phytomonas sp. isolate EM1]